MRNKFILTLLLLFIYIVSYSQKTLSGTVSDEITRSPIPGALLYIPEFQRSVATDEKGKYSFDNLGSGIVNVQVTSIGYKSKVDIVDLSTATGDHDFALEPSAT